MRREQQWKADVRLQQQEAARQLKRMVLARTV
jgi:hypothetical protein